jgi:two-component system response regulator HydG
VLDRDGIISFDDLPGEIEQGSFPAVDSVTIPLGTPMEEVEKILMEETLKRTKGDKGLASKLLGISTRTLYRKMDKKDE